MSEAKSIVPFTDLEQAQLHAFAAAGAARYTASKLQITKLFAGTLPFAAGDNVQDPHGLTDYNRTFFPGIADEKIIPLANHILRLTTGVDDIPKHVQTLGESIPEIEAQLKETPVVFAAGHAGFFEGPVALEIIKRARAEYHKKPCNLAIQEGDTFFPAYYEANRAAHGVATRGFMPVTLGLPVSTELLRRLHLPSVLARRSFVEAVFLRAGTSHYSIPATDRSKATAEKLGIDPTLIKRYNALFKQNWADQATTRSSFDAFNTFLVAASGTSDRKEGAETFIQPVRGRSAELATSIGAAIVPIYISLKKNNGSKNVVMLGQMIKPQEVNEDTLHDIEHERAAFRVACGERAIRYAAPR